MIGKFFYTPRTKRFNVNPRFYDPDKEAREERESRIKDELGIVDKKVDNGKPFSPNVKGRFRDPDAWQIKSSANARKSSNTRLLILIFILTFIVYLFFFSDFNFF